MNNITLTDLTLFFQPLFFAKIGILILLGLYIVFTIVILTQVKTMNGIVKISSASLVLQILAFIHIILAVSLFAFALVIL